MTKHNGFHAFLIAICIPVLLATVYLHFASVEAYRDVLQTPDFVFTNDGPAIAAKYDHIGAPDGRIMMWMWIIIFAWLLLWLIWYLTLMCRTTIDSKTYLYNQGFMHIGIPIVFIIGLLDHVGSVFAMDYDIQIAVTVICFALSLLVFICIELSYKGLNDFGWPLIESDQEEDIGACRALLHNGLGVYATFDFALFTGSLGGNLHSMTSLTTEDAASIAIATNALFIIIYAIVDLAKRDKMMRFTFTPYFTMGAVFASNLSKYTTNWEWDRLHIMIVAALALIFILISVKIGLTVRRSIDKPEPLEPDQQTKQEPGVEAVIVAPPTVVNTPPPQYPYYPYAPNPYSSPDAEASNELYSYYSQFANMSQ